jgi:hypothetical protein
VIGALLGSMLGKLIDGQKLLALFAMLMLAVAVLMLRRRPAEEQRAVRLNRENLPLLAAFGLATGALSGFFGIGGGFLIVPALMFAAGMPILNAVSSSLVAVTAFGLTTAASYAFSGLVDWRLAGLFIAGGVLGGVFGGILARTLAGKRGALNILFAATIAATAIYMLVRTWIAL